MKKLLVLLIALLTVGCSFGSGGAPSGALKNAPDAAIAGVNTENTTIHGLAKGKPLFLNFWATWCPPCVEEMPAVEAMYKKYGDRVNFAAISMDEEPGAAANFIKSRGLTVPVYTGDLKALGKDYQIDAIPRSILIGKDGTILADHLGGMNEAALEEFLSKGL